MSVVEEREILTPGEQRTEKQKEIDAEVLARVKAGIAWLEQTVGPGWVDRINLNELDLSCGECCVLGQVFAGEAAKEPEYMEDGYHWARRTFNWGGHGAELGFSTPVLFDEIVEWEKLQETWEHVLTPLVSTP